MLYIDSDNAMGSRLGDIDDGFAISALLASPLKILALASVAGNTSEKQAYWNNQHLLRLFNRILPLLHGSSAGKKTPNAAANFLSQLSGSYRIATLGPLTNIAKALELGLKQLPEEILIVGGNLSSRGRFPPVWPLEYNLTKDREAAAKVFDSQLPITLLPLDVAKTFQISLKDISQIPGRVGEFLFQKSKRWFLRARILKFSSTVPLWDLAGSLYLLAPQFYTTETFCLKFHPKGLLEKSNSGKLIKAITGFDKTKLWDYYLNLMNQNRR